MVDKSGKRGNTPKTSSQKRGRYVHKPPKRMESGSTGKPASAGNNKQRGLAEKAKGFVSKAVRAGNKIDGTAVARTIARKAIPPLALADAAGAGYIAGTYLNNRYKWSEKITDTAEKFMSGRVGGYTQFNSGVKK